MDPKKRITMRRLLNHRWLTKDHLAPVDPTSKYDDKSLDEELLSNIAIGLGWPRSEMREELLLWKFDALTATYLLVSFLNFQKNSDDFIFSKFQHIILFYNPIFFSFNCAELKAKLARSSTLCP